MIAPDGMIIRLFVRGYVPYIRQDSVSGEYIEISKAEAMGHVCAPAVRIKKKRPENAEEADRPKPDLTASFVSNDPDDMDAADGQLLDEHAQAQLPEPNKDKAAHKRSRMERLKMEALSVRRQMCHYPKNPYCKACMRAKCCRPSRRKGGLMRSTRKWHKFGDLVTADHIVCRSLASHGVKGETDCLMIYDKASNWLHLGPVKSKSANNAYTTSSCNSRVVRKSDWFIRTAPKS